MYRPLDLIIPGAADAADEWLATSGTGMRFGQPEDFGIEIEVPLQSAVTAVHFQQLPVPDQVTNHHRLKVKWLRPATAPGLVLISLDFHQLGKDSGQKKTKAVLSLLVPLSVP